GFFSKSSTEIKIRDIKTIEVHQTLIDRLLGVGEIRLATAGTAGWEVVVKHLLDPQGIREDIQRRRGDENPS
ncbi:MAG TPA: PH domain-containing protein, partial [Synergistaceae bacterium]|nr:PH domain-containing protein [Synergistaceae bacterium]